MGEAFQSPYPLIFAQFHLLGGRRKFIAAAVVFTIVAGGAVIFFRRIASDLTWNEICGNLLHLSAYAQCGIVLLGAPSYIYKALLRDFQSRMIESHRLSPMSKDSVVLGYLIGAPLMSILLFVLNMMFGLTLITGARVPLADWLVGNGLLLSGAVALWSLFIFLGVGSSKPINVVGPMVAIGLSAQVLVLFLPGAALLLGAYSTGTAVSIMLGGTSPGPAAIALMALSGLGFAAFWLNAAAARYRRPDLPALQAVRGGLFLVLWVLLSTLGMTAFQRVSQLKGFSFLANLDVDVTILHWFLSLGGAMFLSLIPLHAAVVLGKVIRRGSAVRGWADRVPAWLLSVLLPLVTLALLYFVAGGHWRHLLADRERAGGGTQSAQSVAAFAFTLIALILANATFAALAKFDVHRSKARRFPASLLTIVLWILPTAFDASRAAYQHGFLSWVFGCSPFGTLLLSWTAFPDLGSLEVSCIPGLLVQFAIAAALVLLSGLHNYRQPSKPVDHAHSALQPAT